MDKSNLAIRMKSYEDVPNNKLIKRMPVIVRLDGKSFHSLTRGLKKPFDEIFTQAMDATMLYLCENIQGCVMGYTQSDEISLLLIDYKTFSSEPWFDNRIEKICSVAASMATLEFNRQLRLHCALKPSVREDKAYFKALGKAIMKGGVFDARCFNLSRDEITNYFYWRQIDAIRNSIQSVAQAYFSDKALHGKNTAQIKEMLKKDFNLDWDDLPIAQQRGTCCVREYNGDYEKEMWDIDGLIPVFKGEGRNYIESRLKEYD